MNITKFGIAIAASVSMFGTGSAQASTVTVTTTSVVAAADVDNDLDRDTTGPVATAHRTKPYSSAGTTDTVTADAVQNEDGFSSLEVNVRSFGMDASASSGARDRVQANASVFREVEFKNTGTTATGAGTFDFRLSGLELEVFNAGGLSDSDRPVIPEGELVFVAIASKGGASVDLFDASIKLTGRYNDFRIENANGFGGSIVREDCYDATCLRGRLPVDTLTGSLDLGILLPGESVTVLTQMRATGIFDTYEAGARVKAVDPNGGSYFSYSFGPTPSPVPLPATAWMLMSALAGAAALRRRNRA